MNKEKNGKSLQVDLAASFCLQLVKYTHGHTTDQEEWAQYKPQPVWVNYTQPSVAVFGHVARLQQDVPAHKALHCHVDLSLGRPPNNQWKRHPADPERDGSTRSERITESPRRTCGGERRVVVTEEQHYGPRRLCNNDTDQCFGIIGRDTGKVFGL